jgi:hypothetical protein
MNTDHIVHNSNTQRMECQHCNFTQAVKMPAPIDSILSTFDAFMEAHKDCKRPPSEAVMSEYIKGFDAGYSYVLTEIERWQDEVGVDLHVLLSHLRMETTKGRENT